MGSCMPFDDNEPFAQKVKALGDDDLLEIWEETQQLDGMLSQALHTGLTLAPEYERAIVDELSLRATRRLSPARK